MKLREIISRACSIALLVAAFASTGFAQTSYYYPATTTVDLSYVPLSLSFNNLGSTSESFSATFQTAPFPTLDFASGQVRASLGISLTDATFGGTGVTLSNLSETATLSYVLSGTTIASAPLTNATLSVNSSNPFPVPAGDGSDTETLRTSGYVPDSINGSFNVLTVTVSGDVPANSTLGLTGRVDVNGALVVPATPEPSSFVLALVATVIFVACLRRRLSF